MTNTITNRGFFAVILTVLAVLLSACGGKAIYYQYKAGESNWHAASTKCKVDAEKIKHGVADVRSNNIFDPSANMAADIMTSINKGRAAQAAYDACLAELGWLPCSEGGTAAHGCKDTSGIDPQSNNTPLHQAAEKGDTAEVRRIIAKGADIHAKKGNGATPLHTAAGWGKTETALALIKAGADIHAKEGNGWTPLQSAVFYGYTETSLALIKAGASLSTRANNGKTPLDIAIEKYGKDSEIARTLQNAI